MDEDKKKNYIVQDINRDNEETVKLVKEVERIFCQEHNMGEEDGNDIKPALWRMARWLIDVALNIAIILLPICMAAALIILLKRGGKTCLMRIRDYLPDIGR